MAQLVAGRTSVFALGMGVVPLILAGCSTDYRLIPIKEDVTEIRVIECPIWECTQAVYIAEDDMDELATCYGWDEEQQSWLGGPGGLPPGGVLGCDPTDGQAYLYSVHTSDPFDGATGDCPAGCAEGEEGTPSPDQCCYDEDEAVTLQNELNASWDFGDADLEELSNDCGITAETRALCTIVEAGSVLGDECPPEAVENVPGADYTLEVDPADSYVTINTPGGQDTVPVEGMGVLDTATTAFLAGMVDATQTLDLAYDWIGWRLWFNMPVDFNVSSGAFTVPYAQSYVIKGRGLRNSDWMEADFEPTANATGVINGGTGRWHVDYYDTFTGGW